MSSQVPDTLRYTKDHEWAKVENDVAYVGITDYAQSALGEIVFVELPEVSSKLERGKTFGVVESIKSVSDLYSPLTGEVLEVNKGAIGNPEQLNQDPYGQWMVKLKLQRPGEVSDLLTSQQYEKHCQEHS